MGAYQVSNAKSLAYYNEWDPYAAQWLRNLISANLIAPGDVDERSIADVQPDDVAGYRQCHWFAGIGGWGLAARLAGWPDSRELWTGSAPCQPYSVAGKGLGRDDPRDLWPHYFRLIEARRPAVAMGEQVAAAISKYWLDRVFDDMEGIGYACGAAVVPACSVNAPHRRDRLWFVADASSGRLHARLERHAGDDGAASGRTQQDRPIAATSSGGDVAYTDEHGCESRDVAAAPSGHWRATESKGSANAWHDAEWIIGHDGKARRVEPGIRLLAHGVPARVGKLRSYGNAIVPAVAAEVIGAYMDCAPESIAA